MRPESDHFIYFIILFSLQFANVYGIFFFWLLSKALDAVATGKIGGQVKAEVPTDDGQKYIDM